MTSKAEAKCKGEGTQTNCACGTHCSSRARAELDGGGCLDWGWLNPGPTESWSRSDSKV